MTREEKLVRFEGWITAFQPVVYRAAYLILRDRSGAEDVAQETFIRAFRAFDRTDPGDGARAWIYKIAMNTALNELRRRKRESAAYARAVDTEAAKPDDPELRSVVADAVDRLAEHLRIPVICRYYLDLSEKEMASVLQLRPGTVKSRLHLARKALSDELATVVNG